MQLLARFRKCGSGAVAIEFALVSLIFIMLSVGVIEFGRALHLRNTISHAVDFAARGLLLDPTATDAALESAIRDSLVNGDESILTITISTETTPSGSARRIVVQYPLILTLPGLADSAITMSLERRVPVIT